MARYCSKVNVNRPLKRCRAGTRAPNLLHHRGGVHEAVWSHSSMQPKALHGCPLQLAQLPEKDACTSAALKRGMYLIGSCHIPTTCHKLLLTLLLASQLSPTPYDRQQHHQNCATCHQPPTWQRRAVPAWRWPAPSCGCSKRKWGVAAD